MRRSITLALTSMVGLAVPAFAQNTPVQGNNSEQSGPTMRDVRPTEGRAATRDETRSGNPNGNGNALEGPNHAPDATRNNGQ